MKEDACGRLETRGIGFCGSQVYGASFGQARFVVMFDQRDSIRSPLTACGLSLPLPLTNWAASTFVKSAEIFSRPYKNRRLICRALSRLSRIFQIGATYAARFLPTFFNTRFCSGYCDKYTQPDWRTLDVPELVAGIEEYRDLVASLLSSNWALLCHRTGSIDRSSLHAAYPMYSREYPAMLTNHRQDNLLAMGPRMPQNLVARYRD